MPHRRAVGNAGAGGTGRTGPSARLWGGCAPHAPIPEERALRAARGPPTHPRVFLSVGAEPPRPRRISARGVAFAGAPNSRWRPAPSPLAGEGWGEGCAARQRGEMEPHAPIGSAARERAATARASAAGICFDRDAGYLAGPPHPHPGGGSGPPARPGFFLHVGGCFDRHARIPRRAPTPPTERWRVSRHPLLLPAPPRVEREPDRPRALYRRRAAPRSAGASQRSPGGESWREGESASPTLASSRPYRDDRGEGARRWPAASAPSTA